MVGNSLNIENQNISILEVAGSRYWMTSLLPAILGTVLPFWFKPANFTFKWMSAVEFLLAAWLFHAGFCLLHRGINGEPIRSWPKAKLIRMAVLFLFAGCLLGLHLHFNLHLRDGVLGYIFIVYGICVFFAGILYIMPPFSLWKRIGGEVVLWQSLAMLPLLGAYLVQVGDITRKVYLAAFPIMLATALWIWLEELQTSSIDKATGRQTAVTELGNRFSGRIVTPLLSIALCGSLILAVIFNVLHWSALLGLLSIGLLWQIIRICWKYYENPDEIQIAEKKAVWVYILSGSILIFSTICVFELFLP